MHVELLQQINYIIWRMERLSSRGTRASGGTAKVTAVILQVERGIQVLEKNAETGEMTVC